MGARAHNVPFFMELTLGKCLQFGQRPDPKPTLQQLLADAEWVWQARMLLGRHDGSSIVRGLIYELTSVLLTGDLPFTPATRRERDHRTEARAVAESSAGWHARAWYRRRDPEHAVIDHQDMAWL